MARKYKQGIFTPKNPDKYQGNANNVIYRSSWEYRMSAWLDSNSSVLKWSSEETVIPYISPIDNRAHRYFIDYKATIKSTSGEIKTYLIEVKPEAQTRPPVAGKKKTKSYLNEVMTWGVNEAKWRAAQNYAAERGMTFILLTEKHLNL